MSWVVVLFCSWEEYYWATCLQLHFQACANFIMMGKGRILMHLEFYLWSAKLFDQIYCSVACIELLLVA
jgi:hypothetical protein